MTIRENMITLVTQIRQATVQNPITPAEIADYLENFFGYANIEFPGKSTYELAVLSGYIGTQAQWLASFTNRTMHTGVQAISTVTGLQVALDNKQSTLGYSPLRLLVKNTYASMIADGTPTVNTVYTVTNDENKSYARSFYLWKTDGNREWIATTPDN